MKTLVKAATLAFFALFGSFSVLAQMRDTVPPSNIPQAPVGHRQPAAADIPEQRTRADEMLDKLNRDLDKKLRSICRGC